MSDRPESLTPPKKIIHGDNVDNVSVERDGVHVFLKDGSYLTFRAILDMNKFGIIPILDRENGFWGRVEEK